MIYVMILYMSISARGEAITTQEFNSKETCEAAKAQIISELKANNWFISWSFISCVKK